jgi:hypothetical protein
MKTKYPQKVSRKDLTILKSVINDLFDEHLYECYVKDIPEEPSRLLSWPDKKEIKAFDSLVDKLIAEKQRLLAQELVKIVTKKFKL